MSVPEPDFSAWRRLQLTQPEWRVAYQERLADGSLQPCTAYLYRTLSGLWSFHLERDWRVVLLGQSDAPRSLGEAIAWAVPFWAPEDGTLAPGQGPAATCEPELIELLTAAQPAHLALSHEMAEQLNCWETFLAACSLIAADHTISATEQALREELPLFGPRRATRPWACVALLLSEIATCRQDGVADLKLVLAPHVSCHELAAAIPPDVLGQLRLCLDMACARDLQAPSRYPLEMFLGHLLSSAVREEVFQCLRLGAEPA